VGQTFSGGGVFSRPGIYEKLQGDKGKGVLLREEKDELVGKDHPLDRRHGQKTRLNQNQP
jgi:hypothetical protein